MSEVRWTRSGVVKNRDWKFYYSGRKKNHAGVDVLVRNPVAKSIDGWWLGFASGSEKKLINLL